MGSWFSNLHIRKTEEITRESVCNCIKDSLAEKKPNALPLVHLVNSLNSTIEKSIMVGDSKNDILAAQNAQMESIGVSYGYNYNENISDYSPTLVIDNFADLQSFF